MAQEQLSRLSAERRCPNCGTRVARDAESCFMCGHDLRIKLRRRQRISWVDALLVLAVLAVLLIWWRVGTQPQQESAAAADPNTILPTNIPMMASGTPQETATPVATFTPVPVTEQTIVAHEVQSGETLLSIAGQYDVTVEEIQAANNLSGELIRVGDRLNIPVLSTPSVAVTSTVGTASNFEYTVRENDTIISIATTFGSSVNAILSTNNLANNAIIRPGDKLLIPVSSVPQAVIASSDDVAPSSPENEVTVANPAEVVYIQPRLIGPADGEVHARSESVLLRWVSVDVLQPNEWYVLLLFPNEGAPIPSIWTKSTSFRLNPTDYPIAEGDAVTFTWQVSVVRVQSGAANQLGLEAASPPSESRTFVWQ